MSTNGSWAWIVSGMLALVACGGRDASRNERDKFLSGTGRVNGTANGEDFTFKATEVLATLDGSAGDDTRQLTVMLCDQTCDRLGLTLAPGSRAIALVVNARDDALRAGGVFAVGQGANALAARRGPDSVDDASDRATQVETASNGQITLLPSPLSAGQPLRGSFDLGLHRGGATLGSFDAPLATATRAPLTH